MSVEGALRDVCHTYGAPLATLDRVLYPFVGMSVVEFAMRDVGGAVWQST